MNNYTFQKARLYITAVVAFTGGAGLAWAHFHGGVASHHFLANKQLPAISNWWGGLLLPLLTWYLLSRVQRNLFGTSTAVDEAPQSLFSVYYGLVGALLFGAIISVLFTLGQTDLAGDFILALFALTLFFPIYRPECLLGFVIGMTFTFGAVLPTIIGLLFSLIGFLLYAYLRPASLSVLSKLARSSSKQNL